MADEHLLLENQLCFRVYSLERAILSAYKPHLRKLGITYPQYLVLLVLWEHASVTIGRLCGLLGLDTGTISPLVKRMESQGLVMRKRLPQDERTVLVSLTAKGEDLRKKATHIPEAIGSCLSGGDSPIDSEGYLRLRDTLDRALDALGSTVCIPEREQ